MMAILCIKYAIKEEVFDRVPSTERHIISKRWERSDRNKRHTL